MLKPDLPWLLTTVDFNFYRAVLVAGLLVIAVILLGWRFFSEAKPAPLEWHIPQYGRKPPCGRWKYLGTILLPWVDPSSRKDRKRAATLERKGITPTYFRVCTNCGKSEIYSGRPGWTCETFKHLLLQVKKAEQAAQEEESHKKDRIEREHKDMIERERKFTESQKQALEWLKSRKGEA